MKLILRIFTYALLTFFFLVLLGGGSQALGLPAELGFAQWGPGIAGLLMLLIFRKDGHTMTLIDRDTPAMYYILAFGIPVLISAILLVLLSITVAEFTLAQTAQGVSLLALIWMPFGALGEEIGWRGYLQKRLASDIKGIWAVVFTGVLWTFIHVQFYAEGPIFVALLMISFIGMSAVIHTLSAEFSLSILLATVLHIGVNAGSMLLFPVILTMGFAVGMAVLWGAAGVVAVMMKREVFL